MRKVSEQQTTLLIMAAGESSRFNGFPKQNLDVGGETLLQRQIRQFKPNCDRIVLSTHRPKNELSHPDVERFSPKMHRWKCESLAWTFPAWGVGNRVIIVHGDVYFTDKTVNRILGYDGNICCAFWDLREVFAMVVPRYCHIQMLKGANDALERLLHNRWMPNENDGGFSCIIREMGKRIATVEIGDETQDFDTPQEYEDWKKGWRKNDIVRGIAKR